MNTSAVPSCLKQDTSFVPPSLGSSIQQLYHFHRVFLGTGSKPAYGTLQPTPHTQKLGNDEKYCSHRHSGPTEPPKQQKSSQFKHILIWCSVRGRCQQTISWVPGLSVWEAHARYGSPILCLGSREIRVEKLAVSSLRPAACWR